MIDQTLKIVDPGIKLFQALFALIFLFRWGSTSSGGIARIAYLLLFRTMVVTTQGGR